MASKSARRRSIGSTGITRTGRRSGRELLPSLGPTTSEHATSALRGHTGHEAMLALARALLGLIRPLRHCCVPFLVQLSRFGRQTHERLAFRQPARTISVGPIRSGRMIAAGYGAV